MTNTPINQNPATNSIPEIKILFCSVFGDLRELNIYRRPDGIYEGTRVIKWSNVAESEVTRFVISKLAVYFLLTNPPKELTTIEQCATEEDWKYWNGLVGKYDKLAKEQER